MNAVATPGEVSSTCPKAEFSRQSGRVSIPEMMLLLLIPVSRHGPSPNGRISDHRLQHSNVLGGNKQEARRGNFKIVLTLLTAMHPAIISHLAGMASAQR
jgi:hypothetical protein